MNSFGHLFRVHTWGESHGKAVGALIDGCPPQVSIDLAFIQSELDQRKPGKSATGEERSGISTRNEDDQVQVLSGIFEGKTLGTPISLLVWNKDAKPEDYEALKNTFRPGHSDRTYQEKYGIRDHRGGGRASGRETVGRVLGGAVAKLLLRENYPELKIHSEIDTMGGKETVSEIPKDDSIGGIIKIEVTGVPTGWGSPVFGKLQAEMGRALLSVGTVKGFEYGEGFAAAGMKGSEHNQKESGGISGGISDGSPIRMRVALKPPSSIPNAIAGRHDACILPRVGVVLESMVALVLVDQWLLHRAQCGPI